MDNLTDNDLVIMVEMAHRTCKLNVLRKARDEQANRKEFEEEAKEIEEEEDKVQEKYYENAGIYRINGKLYKKHYTAEEGSLPCHRCCFGSENGDVDECGRDEFPECNNAYYTMM